MIAAAAGPGGPTSGIDPTYIPDQHLRELQTQMDEYLELVKSGAPEAALKEAEAKIADAVGRENFQIIRQLPHFMRQAAKNVDAAKVYQHFRLPGTDRIVHDRREKPTGEPEKRKDKDVAEAKGEARKKENLELRDGKLARENVRGYVNYLGDRRSLSGLPEAGGQTTRIERLLSAFERLILARFEGGATVAHESPDGLPRFLSKTEAEWRAFFTRFLDRTVSKRVLLSEIREFLFRGVIPRGDRGIVIADMTLAGGRVEKFIRFNVFAEALAKLNALVPGDAFGRAALGDLSGEDLMYLALAVARGRGFTTSPQPTQGKFLGGQVEERAASELGIAFGGQLDAKEKLLRKRTGGRSGSGFGGFGGEREIPEETPYQFIPWWHWGRLTRPGRSRSATVAFYLSLLAIALLGIGILTVRILH